MTRPLAAVTGGTGFLGRHLVRELVAQGWRVRALMRRPTENTWPGLAVERTAGDLADDDALARWAAGADAVIHAAGLIKARRPADFSAVNRDGAVRVAQAAAAHARGAPVLLISSLAAREPRLSSYAGSKRAGEEAMAAMLGHRLTTARPPVIYGPGDAETLGLFRAAATSPVLPVLDDRARLAVVHAADAARHLVDLARGRAAGRTVTLCDGRPEGYAWREILGEAARAVGRRPRLIPVPRAAVRAAGWAGDLAGALGAAPFVTSGKIAEALHRDWSVSAGERDGDAPPPRFTLAEGFRDAVSAYRAEGRLPPARALAAERSQG